MSKPILCLDFDGVIHSYSSGWKGADVIPDPPVPGAMQFIRDAQKYFRVAIFSSRSNQPGGLDAMKDYIAVNSEIGFRDPIVGLEWPLEKPPAMITIDDRAITFTGEWPRIENLLAFQPWNKCEKLGATGEFPRGKFNADDEGELRVAVGTKDKTVIVDFGTPTVWLGMPKENAIAFAKTILEHANSL